MKYGILQDHDTYFKICERRSRRVVPGDWNVYRTYTGAAAGLRAFRKNGAPARRGLHVTPLEIKERRRVAQLAQWAEDDKKRRAEWRRQDLRDAGVTTEWPIG